MTSALELRQVSKIYGSGPTEVDALSEVDVSVERGELVAVMGPSGSGKSTLLAIAGGLDRASGGQVLVDGSDLGALDAKALAELRRRVIGYVFQELNLLATLTAEENVALPLELDGAPARHAAAQARALLGELGLAELAGRFPEELSGGEQQRVAIARAVVGERRLLLADEPTGALDSLTGEAVLRLLRGQCDHGCAAVLVTHDARHAAWADRVVFLRDGRLVDQTAPSDDLHDPRNPGVVT
jgi:putative ABC transport system ATP-binding protein